MSLKEELQNFVNHEKIIRLQAGTGLLSADEHRLVRLLRLAEKQHDLLEDCKSFLSRFDVTVLSTISGDDYKGLCAKLDMSNQ